MSGRGGETTTIIITQDIECDMLKIETSDGKCVFEGNIWDFHRSGEAFKRLFEKLGLEVQLVDRDYDEWDIN